MKPEIMKKIYIGAISNEENQQNVDVKWYLDLPFYDEHASKGVLPRGGGYCHIWAIYRVCAAVKGMVFKQFTLA